MTTDNTNGPPSDETEATTVREPADSDGGPNRSVRSRGLTSRRTFLQAVGAGALLGTIGTGNALASTDSMEFVRTDGTEFLVGDRPVYFNGTNNFWIADPYEDRQRVDDFMSICDDLDMNLVRTWAFCSGHGGHCLQPEPGVYDEAGFQHLDYIIAAARKHGVRLVLPLVNNWSDYGGMAQYVSWSSTASSHDDFYVDSEAQQLYHDFVEYVLTRENSITGIEYRNEPAIAIWELANEPRAKQATDGIARVTQWIEDTSSLIKDLDGNHLVSTGMEGFYDKGGNDWRHDGSHGTAFIDQHQISTIDACTFHLYPDHWPGIDPTVPQQGVDWIVEHVGDAHDTVGKPVYLGEFGISLHENDQSVRNAAYEAYYGALDQYDASGAMVWELVRDSQSNHDGYALYQDGPSITHVNDYTAVQYEKSGGSGAANGDPYAAVVGPSTLRGGETGSFDGSFSFDPELAISQYAWAFGDGATATGESVTHAYSSTGEYQVTLTVTDDGGSTDEATVTLSVTDGAGPTAPSNLSVTSTTQTSVTIDWDAATDGDGDLDHYNVSVDGNLDHQVAVDTTTTMIEGLSSETEYELGVSAVDSAGNASAATTVTATTGSDGGSTEALVINDYDGDPAWSSNTNDLGQWCGGGSFANGSGSVADGALTLEYDNGGWFQEQLNQSISDYSTLVLRVSGASGGEESDIRFEMGGASALLADVTSDAITMSATDVAIDLAAAGVDRSSSSLSLRLNFWQGGSSTLEIEEIRLE